MIDKSQSHIILYLSNSAYSVDQRDKALISGLIDNKHNPFTSIEGFQSFLDHEMETLERRKKLISDIKSDFADKIANLIFVHKRILNGKVYYLSNDFKKLDIHSPILYILGGEYHEDIYSGIITEHFLSLENTTNNPALDECWIIIDIKKPIVCYCCNKEMRIEENWDSFFYDLTNGKTLSTNHLKYNG